MGKTRVSQWVKLFYFMGRSEVLPKQRFTLDTSQVPTRPVLMWINDKEIDEMVGILTDTIDVAVQQSLPRTMRTISKHPISLWTLECILANNERKIALRRYQRSKLMADKISYKRALPKGRLVKRRAKRSSWKQYVSSISCNTPTGKVWKRIRKIR